MTAAEIIANSDQRQERVARLLKAVPSVESKSSALDEQTGDALLRFARFLHQEGEKRRKASPRPQAQNPYLELQQRLESRDQRGSMIDLFV